MTAPSGGLAPRVGLLRTTWCNVTGPPLPSPVGSTVSVPLAIAPPRFGPVTTVLPSSVLAAAFVWVLPSQPAPGRPPVRRRTVNLPPPSAITWAPTLPSGVVPSYSPWTAKSGPASFSLVYAGLGFFLAGSFFRSEEHTSELQSRVDLVCR